MSFSFSHWYSGSGVVFDLSIPDLCTLTYFYCKNMQNLENLNVFEILITQNLQKCPKDPFVRTGLICIDIDKI